ncbi:transcription initiation factor IIA, gamma subunit-domain-containing protein [Polychytrium aggregatum]|uniref:transcription initiation factor IIA, gamma subunit-domain-containing protein n=1 Tax=Polychytrium aggregatum TaxID=110093 RepID=UPI0022FE8CE2|nr:transcription initiation factor IIA, gamma subunit-domain-containing protein [Polychytrium aggregatum]KAI9206869.1 transcription initiation factor IIA, gamma subunit-domain-containing protein [Polychytrium aggregatum]
MAQYELYRRSTLGIALTDTLDELICNDHLDPQEAMKILTQFDISIAEALHQRVRVKAQIKGHLQTYRFCDDVWTFIVENSNLKIDDEPLTVKRVKIVACTARNPPAAGSGAGGGGADHNA